MSGPAGPAPELVRTTFAVEQGRTVSGLLMRPHQASACFVLAHGAGAGMNHRFLEAVAIDLAERGIATFRYQFPFMEAGSKRPDPPRLAHAAVRAAVAETIRLAPDLPLVAGGKSFGGRMTSQAQADTPLPAIRGLAFLAFPLHPAGRVSSDRAGHLDAVRLPMLFLQGGRDALADADLLRSAVDRLGDRATLTMVDQADHAFHVPARSGTTDETVRRGLSDVLARWIEARVPRDPTIDADRSDVKPA